MLTIFYLSYFPILVNTNMETIENIFVNYLLFSDFYAKRAPFWPLSIESGLNFLQFPNDCFILRLPGTKPYLRRTVFISHTRMHNFHMQLPMQLFICCFSYAAFHMPLFICIFLSDVSDISQIYLLAAVRTVSP